MLFVSIPLFILCGTLSYMAHASWTWKPDTNERFVKLLEQDNMGEGYKIIRDSKTNVEYLIVYVGRNGLGICKLEKGE